MLLCGGTTSADATAFVSRSPTAALSRRVLPHPVPVLSKVNETKASIKFQLKKVLCLGVAVANVSMEEAQIRTNIMYSVNFLVSLLKKNWQVGAWGWCG